MSDERRFNDDEIATILEQATVNQQFEQDLAESSSGANVPSSASPRGLSPGEGLTLTQLQEIGTEVGIDPAFLARAAASLERGDNVPTRRQRWLGLPIGVSRTIDFGRRIDDNEWERIVVMLRETFEARGRLKAEGSFRQWTNGNLQALLEPTSTGHRLRLSTRKGDVKGMVAIGIGLLGAAVGTLLMSVSGDPSVALAGPALLGVSGIASILSTSIRLPSWSKTRASQMEQIANRAARITG